MTTVRATVEYDGTAFSGLQVQSEVRTVAAELTQALSKIFEEDVKLAAAGRTDAGVHATGQVISFKTAREFPFARLPIAANSILPPDIRIRTAAPVADDFSARFSARERTYVYAILNRAEPSALLGRYAFHYWSPIDLDVFGQAAQALLGEHDFRSFCGMLPDSGPTIRIVNNVHAERRGEIVRIEIRADGFLHRMVRVIVGTLLECATGRRDPTSMQAILDARDRSAAGITAPAQGLYLAGARYADGFDSFREPPVTGAP